MTDFNERIIDAFRANGGHVATMGFGEYERRTSRTIAGFHLVRDPA